MSRSSLYCQRRWDERRTGAIARFEQNVKDYEQTVKHKRQLAAKEKDKEKAEELLSSADAWSKKIDTIRTVLENTRSNMGIGSSAKHRAAPVSVALESSI